MAKKRVVYLCEHCGYESSGWLGKCPKCNSWNSFSEVLVQPESKAKQHTSWLETDEQEGQAEIINLAEVEQSDKDRLQTHIPELDLILGGGLVKGSLVLLGGDPGIGKSTLLLQAFGSLHKDVRSIYVAGEESPAQIKMRANRLGYGKQSIKVFTGTSFAEISRLLQEQKPDFVAIDSIQTIYLDDLPAAPGSVTQIRECTAGLLRLAKQHNIAIVLIGHVTKEGRIAGPRVLEHMVDAVLYFEGDRAGQYRMLRAVKNRFGTTNEIGLFEMTQNGLESVQNPGMALLSGRPINVPGTAITSCLEGSRSILIEVQALLTASDFSQPIRNTQGIDRLRLMMLLAILQKSCQIQTGSYDAYVNVTGGMKINETSADLAIVAAIVSSIQDKSIDSETILLGELGLAGEIRIVSGIEKRILEACKLGWRKFIVPALSKAKLKKLALPGDCEIFYVSYLKEVLDILFF